MSSVVAEAVARILEALPARLLPGSPFSDGRSFIVACVMDSSSSEVMCSDFMVSAERELVV